MSDEEVGENQAPEEDLETARRPARRPGSKSARRPGSKSKKGLVVRTLFLLAMCGLAAFFLLGSRLYDIQITNGGYYSAQALSNQLRHSSLSASRGTIYDSNGGILAISAPVENVFISPLEIERDNQDLGLIASGLSEILGVDRGAIIEMAARTASQYQLVKTGVESEEAQLVRDFIGENRLRGVHLEPATKRYYPGGSLASQIIGFVGTDNTGLDGLEQRYDDRLTGVGGREVRLTNLLGTDLMFSDYEDRYSAHDGLDLTLTIDSSIQYFVEKHLEQAIVDYDVQNGAMCIAMDPRTGAILAMANYPNFDPNDFLSLGDRETERLASIEDEEERREAFRAAQFLQWRNRSLADTYEPGSVFKILTYAMAIEEGLAAKGSEFYCSGSMDILGSQTARHCWRRRGHGLMSLEQAIEHSCNIVCIELGLRLGPQAFYRYVSAFGLFDKTGLDNSAEGRSLWWSEDIFFDRDNQSQLASASFGQTFKVTPIQMISAVSAVINGGYLMQPYIVSQITDSSGYIVEETEPTIRRQVISGDTSALMRELLETVVVSGTGKNAQVMGYRVGGKTGTSENTEQLAAHDPDEAVQKDYIVSFVGFAPADDPQIVILLLLDTPGRSTGIEIGGGSMAAPVVGNMLADILPLSLGIVPSYSDEDLRDINVIVPRISGRSVQEASDILADMGFEVAVVGEGDLVTGQLPAQNAHVASGTKVVIYAGEEPPRDMVVTPQLSGMTYQAAKQALENCGIFIRTTGAHRSDSRVRVSVQSIPAGQETPYGSVVEVTLIDRDVIELRN